MNRRNRHAKDRESRRNPLFHLVLEAVTAALCWHGPPRPDSSRQHTAKLRAKALKQARVEKTRPVIIVAPPDPAWDHRPNRFFW